MGEVLLGAVALALFLLLVRLYVGADPKALVKALRYAGAGALLLVAIAFFLTERIGAAVFIAAAAYSLFTKGHLWPGGWPHYGIPGGWGGGAKAKPGQSTAVRTEWLQVELDHDTGEMRGTVLKGAFAGRALDDLSANDAIALYREAGGADNETARLLEAWLDRRFPDWRNAFQQKPPSPGGSGMTREEALKVLGLSEGASETDIRAAHKKLMMQNHPDRGGSDYLASKINEAKDVLLS
ncbi:MAG TPA: DnaJ domain-containing protein [Rhizomicrobium sp.]|jgi:hypothetical protein|nr:DnaJ domain-containing protein [Rhizomicrobium sp.]